MQLRCPGWRPFPRPAIALCATFVALSLTEGRVHGQARFDGEGRVVAIGQARDSLTLDHGPIPGLMAAMRMAFGVASPELLRGLEVGAVVRFSLEQRGSEWIIVAIRSQAASSGGRTASLLAPDFTLPVLAGGSLRLSELRGKPVVLNFWATWCVPCRTEMPALESLYRRYRDQGLEVVGVNMDMVSADGVAAFVKEVGVTFPVVLDPRWTAAHVYHVVGLPTTYLIDRAGNVVVREVGERNWADELSVSAVGKLVK